MKTCTKPTCRHGGAPQAESNFHKDRQKKDGLRPQCRDCTNDATKAYQAALSPEVRKAKRAHADRKWAYGLTPEDWDRLVARADGRCESCGDPVTEWRVDHCHTTGVVRGLVCNGCNVGMGQMKDDPLRLRKAAEYLERAGSY